ncbi:MULTISPECIES: GTPase [Rhodanobacteraceae]|uniref:GTPase n=1 Tax=Rhodanobacteraceae TaxID=1775411 RepID=UPI00088AB66D|nr:MULTISPECIES: GTPase [Rhodanobacteraceae]SDF96704.1 50S ribosome-binding GTPase [Dyella sp. 333MFSha]SKB32994.1 50S ribosome-binding GTPase [Luteibacter sp. 22Crub2.1]
MSVESRLRKHLPKHAHEIDRLMALLQSGAPPVVTVVGKYNHGKSSLLNELIGSEIFAVADVRTTVELQPHGTETAQWLDAPGLDADVTGSDDQKAALAADFRGDIRLFVHSVKEGELDAEELRLFREYWADDKATGRKTLLVLSQADQVPDGAVLTKVCDTITGQVEGYPHTLVSSTRHQKGRMEQKNLLVDHSGIPALQRVIERAVEGVKSARRVEAATLADRLDQALKKKGRALRKKRDEMVADAGDVETSFLQNMQRAVDTAISMMRSN